MNLKKELKALGVKRVVLNIGQDCTAYDLGIVMLDGRWGDDYYRGSIPKGKDFLDSIKRLIPLIH